MLRLLAITLLGAVAVGLIAGGRLSRLADVRFRLAWLGLLGVGLQVPSVSGTAGDLLLLASLACLLTVVAANLRLPGFALVLLGLTLNVVVIGVNRGMPVSESAIVASGQASTLEELRRSDSPKHHLMGPEDRLTFLADVIAIPPPIRQAVSVGDLAALLGIGWFLVGTMRRRPPVPAPAPARGAPPKERRARPWRLLRHRDFRLLFVSQTLTMFGDVALVLVFGIWVKDVTGSNSLAGAVFFAYMVPSVIMPLVGPVIDRFPRRSIMIVADLATMAVALSLLLVRGTEDVWIIFVVAFLYGALQIVFFAARSGLLVTMLPSEDLAEANGLIESLRSGMRIVGPSAGAGLYALWGGGAVALLDASVFLIAVVLLSRIRAPDLARSASEESAWQELTAGVRHIARTTDLRNVVFYTAAVLVVLGIIEVAVFALIEDGLDRSPEFLGVLSTSEGLGAVVGGLLAAWAMLRLGEVRMAAAALAGFGAAIGLHAVARLPVVLPAAVISGVFVAFYFVAYQTLIQRRTTAELQGRVFTASEAITTLPYSLSIGLGAVIIDVVDFRFLYLATAGACVLGGVLLYRTASERALGPAEVPPGSEAVIAPTPSLPATEPPPTLPIAEVAGIEADPPSEP